MLYDSVKTVILHQGNRFIYDPPYTQHLKVDKLEGRNFENLLIKRFVW